MPTMRVQEQKLNSPSRLQVSRVKNQLDYERKNNKEAAVEQKEEALRQEREQLKQLQEVRAGREGAGEVGCPATSMLPRQLGPGTGMPVRAGGWRQQEAAFRSVLEGRGGP
jgi:hypothetical protein